MDDDNSPHPGSSSATVRLNPNSENHSQITETEPSDASELAGLSQLAEDE